MTIPLHTDVRIRAVPRLKGQSMINCANNTRQLTESAQRLRYLAMNSTPGNLVAPLFLRHNLRMNASTKALAVHWLTASGAVFAMLAMLEAINRDWSAMFVWLIVAFAVDGIDGSVVSDNAFDLVHRMASRYAVKAQGRPTKTAKAGRISEIVPKNAANKANDKIISGRKSPSEKPTEIDKHIGEVSTAQNHALTQSYPM